MVTQLLTKRALAAGGLGLALFTGIGIASADPDLGPAINTTCTYEQVLAAMNAQAPGTAAQFNASPQAQAWLRNFLASPPEQRTQLAQQAQNAPDAQQFLDLFVPLAATCNTY